jgi:nucleotide-binding universal stress UspA family protein
MKDNPTRGTGKGARLSVHAKPGQASGASAAAHDLSMVPSYLQLKQILVPIDFSPPSEKALKYAVRFAEQFGSSVTLLHVIQPVVYPADFGYPAPVVDTLDDAVQKQVEDRLQALARQSNLEMRTLVRVGQPYHEITTAAKELDVDLIIITTHGHTGLKHVLLGSTAERVVRHAPCPVLTLREREHDFV